MGCWSKLFRFKLHDSRLALRANTRAGFGFPAIYPFATPAADTAGKEPVNLSRMRS
jgi:hypothetical protein